MTLESSAVIFQALKPLQPHWPHRPLRPQWPLQPQKPYFTKELPDSDGWIILGTKMTNSCQFLWNSSSKIQFFTDFSTFSAGGCWGQPMLLFWKLGQETQMSTPPEATRHKIPTLLLVLLHLRAIYFSTFQYETPCIYNIIKDSFECFSIKDHLFKTPAICRGHCVLNGVLRGHILGI